MNPNCWLDEDQTLSLGARLRRVWHSLWCDARIEWWPEHHRRRAETTPARGIHQHPPARGHVPVLTGGRCNLQPDHCPTAQVYRQLTAHVGVVHFPPVRARHYDTLVPDSISGPIQDSRIAAEWNTTNAEKTKTEAKKAELVEQIGKIRQIEQVVEFETQRIEGTIAAEKEKAVNEIAAQTRLLVAELERQTAVIQADTRRKLGAAEAKVVELKGKAEGDGYAQLVKAVGAAADYVAYQFAQGLPAQVKLKLIYAGPGTLWTDLEKAGNLAPLELLRQGNPQKP